MATSRSLAPGVVDEFAVHVDFALGRILDAADHLEYRALATARGAQERDEFALFDAERNVSNHMLAVEHLAYLDELNRGSATFF